MDTTNNQSGDDKEIKKLEDDLNSLTEDIIRNREEFKKNTDSITEKIEDETEISEDEIGENAEIEEVEKEFDNELNEIIIESTGEKAAL